MRKYHSPCEDCDCCRTDAMAACLIIEGMLVLAGCGAYYERLAQVEKSAPDTVTTHKMVTE